MNNDIEMNLKDFEVIFPYNWVIDDKKYETKVFGDCPSFIEESNPY